MLDDQARRVPLLRQAIVLPVVLALYLVLRDTPGPVTLVGLAEPPGGTGARRGRDRDAAELGAQSLGASRRKAVLADACLLLCTFCATRRRLLCSGLRPAARQESALVADTVALAQHTHLNRSVCFVCFVLSAGA